jgi:hypothetical protein
MGSKYRRKAIKEYQNMTYRSCSVDNDFVIRGSCTQGILLAERRKF